MSGSVFLPNLHYFLAQTDGTYRFPNSAEGDLLKRAKVEVEALQRENAALREDKERLDELLEHGVVGWYAGPRKWIGDQKITRCYTREDIDAARAKEGEA